MKYVPNAVSRKVGSTSLALSKNSPTILFAAGVVGFGATVVLACRATLKVEEVLSDTQKDLMNVNTVQHATYSEKDRKHDKAVIYIRSTLKLGSLYGPAIGVGVLSVAALTGSHHILSKRNAGLTAAYAALEKGFNAYRARVVDELGEEKDREFRYGTVEVKEIVQGKDGPVEKTTKQLNPGQHSVYAKMFDLYNPNWQSIPEYNRLFLNSVQNYMNDRLHSRGHLFLNEVYDALGFDRTQAGAVVGWRLTRDGDNYVDFGMWNKDNQATRDFVNGHEPSILLDFNVDGVVFDKIEETAL
jgi:hypothetical protein